MLRATSKYRFWVITVCLLALGLSMASPELPAAESLDNSGTASPEILFSSVSTSASSANLASYKRTRLHGIDGLLAVLPRKGANLTKRISFPFLSNENAEVTHCAENSASPIRAPPVRHS
jgi:hypothetical protein